MKIVFVSAVTNSGLKCFLDFWFFFKINYFVVSGVENDWEYLTKTRGTLFFQEN